MSSKFDDYEKERLERELKLWNLKVKLFLCLLKLKNWNMQLTEWSNIEDVTSILIHGLPEVKGEDTNSLVIETVKEKMGLDISSADIERTHRISSPTFAPKQVR